MTGSQSEGVDEQRPRVSRRPERDKGQCRSRNDFRRWGEWGSIRGNRVRPADCLVLLHEVNKLQRSKASWSSIIPKWEVGEVERWSEGKRREGRVGLQSGTEGSRSRSGKGEL